MEHGEAGSGTRYSIETLPDGKRYVQADRQVITSDNPDNWGQEITDYINQKIRNGEDVAIPTEDGDVVLITEKLRGKWQTDTQGVRNQLEIDRYCLIRIIGQRQMQPGTLTNCYLCREKREAQYRTNRGNMEILQRTAGNPELDILWMEMGSITACAFPPRKMPTVA